jgi:hypothetical protein
LKPQGTRTIFTSSLGNWPTEDISNLLKLEIENLITTSMLTPQYNLKKEFRVTFPNPSPPRVDVTDAPEVDSVQDRKSKNSTSLGESLIPPSRGDWVGRGVERGSSVSSWATEQSRSSRKETKESIGQVTGSEKRRSIREKELKLRPFKV